MSRTEEFLGIRPGDVVAFVGSGGKTTLLHSVAQRLVKEGRRVLLTATRSFAPLPAESRCLFLTDERPLETLAPNLAEHGMVTVAPRRLAADLLAGYEPGGLAMLGGLADYLFVEADDGGSAVPDDATAICAVAGLTALGPDLDPAGLAAALLAEESPLRCRPDLSRRVLCLNQADRRPEQRLGAEVARAIFAGWQGEPPPRILLTSVREFLRPLS